jgi:hypothetical protein
MDAVIAQVRHDGRHEARLALDIVMREAVKQAAKNAETAAVARRGLLSGSSSASPTGAMAKSANDNRRLSSEHRRIVGAQQQSQPRADAYRYGERL